VRHIGPERSADCTIWLECSGQRQPPDDRTVGIQQVLQAMLGRQNLAGLVDDLSHQPLNRQRILRPVSDLTQSPV
jgi:hypothetical protein